MNSELVSYRILKQQLEKISAADGAKNTRTKEQMREMSWRRNSSGTTVSEIANHIRHAGMQAKAEANVLTVTGSSRTIQISYPVNQARENMSRN